MNAHSDTAAVDTPAQSALVDAVTEACRLIAPNWPLDRSIAVNPCWKMIDRPLQACGAMLAARGGAHLTPPRDWLRMQWQQNLIRSEHLEAACADAGIDVDTSALVRQLDEAPDTHFMALMTDVRDAHRDLRRHMAWKDEVTHQISQSCAAYFDAGQGSFRPSHTAGLYREWNAMAAADRGMAMVMGAPHLHKRFAALPHDPVAVIHDALHALGVAASNHVKYLHALLLSVNGWASWCAYLSWQAGLEGREDAHLLQLLAVRLAWEWVLHESTDDPAIGTDWRAAQTEWDTLYQHNLDAQQHDWIWLQAAEHAYQDTLLTQFSQPAPAAPSSADVEVQAAFCIDVRSEVMRRALEQVDDSVQTLGFAGFFGLPIAHRPLASAQSRPQLPGLLAPRLQTLEQSPSGPQATEHLRQTRQARLELTDHWHGIGESAPSVFTLVEATGLFAGLDMLRRSFRRPRRDTSDAEHASTAPQQLEPVLAGHLGSLDALALDEQVDLAAGILRGLTLTEHQAPLVLLVGHGSSSANNPNAAGLDCGACCGQSGDVNARVAAALLNQTEVRDGLRSRGITVSAHTHFLPALHNTTTDSIELLDLWRLPEGQKARVQKLRNWLQNAGDTARVERAERWQLHADRKATLKTALEFRGRDWSQVRPEWGLANNAAFIIAPRSRSRHLDLAGRSFLHDYDWSNDPDFGLLEQIMTAPMIVAHWINMQYYASTVDNPLYGSGNKVLHNVVGARLGVFEGNGGDLRIGLPMQSLHDGREWRHGPLRMSAMIAAPTDAINRIIARHDPVRELVDNGWIHVFALPDDGSPIMRYAGHSRWRPA